MPAPKTVGMLVDQGCRWIAAIYRTNTNHPFVLKTHWKYASSPVAALSKRMWSVMFRTFKLAPRSAGMFTVLQHTDAIHKKLHSKLIAS